MMVLICLGE